MDRNVYRSCGPDHRYFASDIDNSERVNAPYRNTIVDCKISASSLNITGKGGGIDHHGKMAKNTKQWEKVTEEVMQEYKWEVERIPDIAKMSLKSLKCPYSPGNTFWLNVPEGTTAKGEVYARATMLEIYQQFQSMAPALSFTPSFKTLKCKGSFTQSCSSCIWEIQIWLVDPSVARSKSPKNEYIFECRRKSKDGREAFSRLVQLIGVFLKEQGRATMYANGCEIFPPVAPTEDLGGLAMPGFGSPIHDFSMMPMSKCRSSKFPISLDEDSVERMTVGIAERRYPECYENMALLAQCAVDKDNLEVLQASDELQEAVHQELMKSADLSTCINALTLMEHGLASPVGGLSAAARSLVVHSGFKGSDFKGPRSRAVECKALRVMSKLASQLGEDREKTLLEIENDIRGKLHHEVFSKVVDIRTGCRTMNDF